MNYGEFKSLEEEIIRCAIAIVMLKRFSVYEDENGGLCHVGGADVAMHCEEFQRRFEMASDRLVLHKIYGPAPKKMGEEEKAYLDEHTMDLLNGRYHKEREKDNE